MTPALLAADFEFDWGIFLRQIFTPSPVFWRALATTLGIAIVAEVVGIMIGLMLAMMNLSRYRAVRFVAKTYALVVRGTPLIVQIFFVYYGANLLVGFSLFPQSVSFFGFELSGAVLAGIVALAVNEGAYVMEIVRSGIESIPRGQREAARTLGMSHALTMRRIVLPQAVRVMVPPLGNNFNIMLKATSLLFVIGVYEIFADAQVRYSATFRPVEYFAAVAFWYLVLTSIWTLLQNRIERRLALPDANASLARKSRFFRRLDARESM